MNHRVIRVVLALAIGLTLALYAYDRATDPLPRQQRAQEEEVVQQARGIVKTLVAPTSDLEFVDPLSPNRRVGKAYIYPTDAGWEVSGHYRRSDADPWHAWLMTLDSAMRLQALSVRDGSPQLIELASQDPRFKAGL